jgi:MYXO-CTERM domain-containing protein
LAALLATTACAAPESDEPTGTTEQAIVNGTTSSQEAVIAINEDGYASCTGVLIAPNLVLTARHCVTNFSESSECGGPLGGEIPTSAITVSTGTFPQGWAARAKKFFVPAAKDLCGADVALVLLDKNLTAQPLQLRFAPPVANEVGTAIGYGESVERKQRADVKVLAIGPADAKYTTKSGQSLTTHLRANEFTTGESTCFGDSGGPLVDAVGRVFAVASRGLDDRCADRPTFWTILAPHEKLIRDAATAAGHPLPVDSGPPPNARGSSSGEPSNSPDGPAAPANGNETSTPQSKKDDGEIASSGCSATGARSQADFAFVASVALGALLFRQRRSRHAPKSRAR